MIIEKKIWSEYFKLVKSGEKKAKIKLNDFEIKKGDIVVLKEWNPEKGIHECENFEKS